MDVRTISYHESAARLRALLKTGLLRHTDLRDHPDRFFLAHRLLARHAPQLGPGFWVRFTVHYNLCAGTVLALGNEDQVRLLDEWQAEGSLGCFALTEKLAGVSSGLVVNTQAHLQDDGTFLLHSPDRGAFKNWISQGLVADRSVVVADLRVRGRSCGPHAFLMSVRDSQGGEPVTGVVLEDMGAKTVGNDLDNAAIGFDKVVLPRSALLNRFSDIAADGSGVEQKVEGMPLFHMIGQRLFTGRVAVAQAALEFRRGLFASTRAYADAKPCWAPSGNPVLSDIPQLKALFVENEQSLARLDAFVGKCEARLSEALRAGEVPSVSLVDAIAVAKVAAVESSIDICHRLKNDVGSYALMVGSGFENQDFLTMCKFAEGDSRVLMQKMARDRLRLFEKQQQKGGGADAAAWDEETRECAALSADLAAAVAANRGKSGGSAAGDGGDSGGNPGKQAAWDAHWEQVYALAHTIMRNKMDSFMAE